MTVSGSEINGNFISGDIVYACAFSSSKDKNGNHYVKKPVRGMLTCGKTKAMDSFYVERGCTEPSYFVPFKMNGKDLYWSKAVSVYFHYLSSTEEESKQFYNKLINDYIESLSCEIDRVKKELI